MKFLIVFFLAFATVAHGVFTDIQSAAKLGGFIHIPGVDSVEVLVDSVLKKTNINKDTLCLSVDDVDVCLGDKTGRVVQTLKDVVTKHNLITKLDLLGKVDRDNNKNVAVYGDVDHVSRHLVVKTHADVADEIKGVLIKFVEALSGLGGGVGGDGGGGRSTSGSSERSSSRRSGRGLGRGLGRNSGRNVNSREITKVCAGSRDVKCIEGDAENIVPVLKVALKKIAKIVDVALGRSGIIEGVIDGKRYG